MNESQDSELPVIAGIGPSLYLELPAIVVGALSGGGHAVGKGFDATGVIVLAITTGLGGGILRDVLLGHLPPLALERPVYLQLAFVSAAVAFFFTRHVDRIQPLLTFVDAAALGFFGVVGAQQAIAHRLPFLGVLLVGVVCATAGGLLRDVLARDVPTLLAPGPLYATVAGLGVVVYFVIRIVLGRPRAWAEFAAIATTMVVRTLASWRKWHGPRPRSIVPRP